MTVDNQKIDAAARFNEILFQMGELRLFTKILEQINESKLDFEENAKLLKIVGTAIARPFGADYSGENK